MVKGVSGGDRAGTRMRAAGIRVEGTHEPTNGFKMTEVGEGGRFWLVVILGRDHVLVIHWGRAGQGGGLGECACRARVWVRQQ